MQCRGKSCSCHASCLSYGGPIGCARIVRIGGWWLREREEREDYVDFNYVVNISDFNRLN